MNLNAKLASLTAREREVMDLMVLGDANKVIAYKLDMSPRTVEVHRERVFAKMGAASLAELVRVMVEAPLLAKIAELESMLYRQAA